MGGNELFESNRVNKVRVESERYEDVNSQTGVHLFSYLIENPMNSLTKIRVRTAIKLKNSFSSEGLYVHIRTHVYFWHDDQQNQNISCCCG